ncbi:MAG: Flp family type IVb pilin [Rhizobiaceae bacterium]
MKLPHHLKVFFRDESGATAVEYAIVVLLIGIASVGAFTVAGNSLDASLTNTASQIPG